MSRLYKFISEARKNPHLNPKIGIVDELRKYKDREDVYISFTNVNKTGLNPINKFDTPIGIYAYPIKYIWDELERDDVPFGGDRKYVNVFKVSHPNLLELSSYTEEQYENDKRKLKKLYAKELESEIKVWNSFVANAELGAFTQNPYSKMMNLTRNLSAKIVSQLKQNDPVALLLKKKEAEVKELEEKVLHKKEIIFDLAPNVPKEFLEDYEKLHNEYANKLSVVNDLQDELDNAPNIYKKRSTIYWNKILQNLGYIGLTDKKGLGVIHNNEPTQAVFFSSKYIKPIKMLYNKRYNTVIINSIEQLDNFDRMFEFVDLINGNTVNKNGKKYILDKEFFTKKYDEMVDVIFTKFKNAYDLYYILGTISKNLSKDQFVSYLNKIDSNSIIKQNKHYMLDIYNKLNRCNSEYAKLFLKKHDYIYFIISSRRHAFVGEKHDVKKELKSTINDYLIMLKNSPPSKKKFPSIQSMYKDIKEMKLEYNKIKD